MNKEKPVVKGINPLEAVQLLVNHIDANILDRQKAKDIGSRFIPSPSQKVERDRLLRQLIASLEMTRQELLYHLQIDRATWDRWRIMTTIPQRVNMETLLRLANEKLGKIEQNDEHFETVARCCRKMYDALIEVGFTPDQAIQIVSAQQIAITK